jgi:putative redox protein
MQESAVGRKTIPLRFPGSVGATLTGRLETPVDEPSAYALFAHCFTCSKDLKAVSAISRLLAGKGFGVFRFDFTGLGESEGDFAQTSFSSNLDDLVAAADFLRREYRAPEILIGHSLGGAAVLAAARRVPESKGVAAIAAPSDTEHLRQLLLKQVPEIEKAGEAMIDLGGRRFTIRKQLLDDLGAAHVQENLRDLGRALILFHSPGDSIVSFDQAGILFGAATGSKSFISLDGADHLLTNDRDARYVADILATWASRLL